MPNINGYTYEFVPKSEFTPVKKKIETLIRKIQKEIRATHKITFSVELIGSGGRNLITRVVNGNKGFDFDYNFVIQKIPSSIKRESEIFRIFSDELKNCSGQFDFNYVGDKEQVIKIRKIDSKNKKIEYGCDFAIVKKGVDKSSDYYEDILTKDPTNSNCNWIRRTMGNAFNPKLDALISNGLWSDIRNEYLILKNGNKDKNKKSFVLYYEAVNNVYNRYDWN